ncbi:MFS transporter [Planctomycetota bacterium]
METKLDNKRTIFCWALYDWANSAYATTVMAGFFPVFFKIFWNAGVEPTTCTARLGIGNSIAGITVAVAAPILGAIADRGSAKKRFLLFFATLGVVMTIGLFLVHEGHWIGALVLYVLATIGFSGGNIFYDALIVGIASERKMDMVSALGYSLGYLGGALLFTVNVFMVEKPAFFGLSDSSQAVRLSFVTVGVWWAVFSIPILLFVKEPSGPTLVSGMGMVRAGLTQLASTFKHIRASRTIFLFLLAYWFYIDGVDTIIRMAVDYGMSIGLASSDLIKALLLTNFIGFPAALAFGWIGKRSGAKRGIYIAICVYLGVTIWATFMSHRWEFYVLAAIIGLVQGGIQALSRSYFTRLIPSDKAAEFFGFYNMLGKFAVVIGPLLVGVVGWAVYQLGAPTELASRMSIASVALLFIVGGALLFHVRTPLIVEDNA